MSDQEKREIFSEIEKRGTAIRNSFHLHDKDVMVSVVNGFYSGCLNQFQNDKFLFPKIQLEYFFCLNYFGQYYDSFQTFENLIKEYDKPEVKEVLFTKHQVESKLVTANTYIMYHNLLWNQANKTNSPGDIINKKEFISHLMKAKSKLSSLYSQYLSSNKSLTQSQLIQCLESLSFCYASLSRWSEALYYSGLGEKLEPDNLNLNFTKQAVLERVQHATCTTFSKQLILSTLESIKKLEVVKEYPEATKLGFERIKKENEKTLKKNKITLESIIEHREKGVLQYSKRTNYLKFCTDNKLFLSEHSLHCNCNVGIQDKITIRSSHKHTQIEFILPFEEVLKSVTIDYILARKNYYNSLDNQVVLGYQTRFTKIENIDFNLKVALLKDSFRLCYSVLDTIAIAILEALEIDYLTIRKSGANSKIHFTNIWDDLITSEHFEKNFYVQALYSISEDINANVGGHKEFRSIRNAMEHKIFHVKTGKKSDKKIQFKSANYFEIEYQELSKKTIVLLVYTKSLIHTFTYFMRRVSVSKAKVDNSH